MYTLSILLLFTSFSSANIRESFLPIQDYSTPFPFEQVLADHRNLTPSEYELIYSRLMYELTNMPDQSPAFKVDDLKHIDVMIQLISKFAIGRGFYSDIIKLDNLAGRKLYNHPLYSQLWYYQIAKLYYLANRELIADDRARGRGDMLLGELNRHIQTVMSQDSRSGSRSYTVSYEQYVARDLLPNVSNFINELTYYTVNPETGLLERPKDLIIPSQSVDMVSDDKTARAAKRGWLKPNTDASVCRDLFNSSTEVYMPVRPSSKRTIN